jgi:hypothetical protein
MHRPRVVALAFPLLAGCSATKVATTKSTGSVDPLAVSSTSETPSQSARTWTASQAQHQYLADAATLNADLAAYNI